MITKRPISGQPKALCAAAWCAQPLQLRASMVPDPALSAGRCSVFSVALSRNWYWSALKF